jgi:deoxycytidylate deaminase
MKTVSRDKHHDWSYKYEIHAEMNAIVWAARN